MKILVLAGWYPQFGRSGNGIFIVRQAEALAEAGQAEGLDLGVDLMAVQPQSWMSTQGMDAELPEAPVRHWLRIYKDGGWGFVALWKQYKAWRSLWAAYRVHHSGEPDVIIAQVSWKAAVVAACTGIPFMVVEHWSGWLHDKLPLPWWQRILVFWALRRASKVFAVSPWLAEAIQNKVSGLKVEVLPNVVEQHFWATDSRIPPSKSKHFIHISDLARVKNPDLLFKAWVMSGLAQQGFRLRVGGEYPYYQQEKYKEIPGIDWLGVLDSEEVARELRMARALLLPSIRETFSILTVESLLCHCPVWLSYAPLRNKYQLHPLVIALDPSQPEKWSEALQQNVMADHFIQDVYDTINDGLENYQSSQVGMEFLRAIHNLPR